MTTLALTRFAYSPDGTFGRLVDKECLDDNPPRTTQRIRRKAGIAPAWLRGGLSDTD